MNLRLDRRFATLLIATSLAVALGPATSATAAATPPAHVGSTPAFPAPASERASPTTTGHAPATVTGGAATPFKSTSTAPARTRARSKPSSKLSTAAIVVAAVAALLALGCAAWGLARRRAFEPHWLLTLRHAMAEAGFRTSATWAEFADWARLGH
jgi:hypothetical protein